MVDSVNKTIGVRMETKFIVTTQIDPSKELLEKLEFLKKKAIDKGFEDFGKWWPKVEEILAYSIATIEDGTPVCCNLLQTRTFYNGMARVGSRYYIDSVNRSLKTPWMAAKGDTRPFTVQMIDDQTDIAEQMGYRGVFFSRKANYLILKNIYTGMQKRSKYKDWILGDKYIQYKLCNGPGCDQWVVWRGELTLCPTNL